MAGPDLTQFVTRAELQPLAEIRTMLRDDLRGLHEGQVRLSQQMQSMEIAITDRMDEANHRTTKLEEKLDATEAEVQDARDTAKTVLHDGCRQRANHVLAMTTLARVGALEDVDDAPVSDRANDARPFLEKHGRKAAVAGGIGLGGFGLGVLAPHVGPFLDWFIHLFMKAPK
jgi:hypothetical protein